MVSFDLVLIIFFIDSVVSEDIKDLSINQLVKLAEDTSRVRIGDVKSDDVTFHLFTQSDEQLNETSDIIDITKPTKFIIHGWIANNRRSWYRTLTEEFLKNDCNVIQVDWEQPARTAYISAAINTKLIGQRVAQFVIDKRIPPGNVHLIGHSLGAHISGFAGKRIRAVTGAKIGRISGLDPAGPCFREYALVKTERLDKDDAKMVDVIHTDSGIYGIDFPVGTLDIYPNLGRAPQPACLSNINIVSLGDLIEHSYCSHEISIAYFIEWIGFGKFHCTFCQSWHHFRNNSCTNVDITEGGLNENVTGICVTKTHQHKPFLSQ